MKPDKARVTIAGEYFSNFLDLSRKIENLSVMRDAICDKFNLMNIDYNVMNSPDVIGADSSYELLNAINNDIKEASLAYGDMAKNVYKAIKAMSVDRARVLILLYIRGIKSVDVERELNVCKRTVLDLKTSALEEAYEIIFKNHSDTDTKP